jgi:hypothetical protein
MERPYAGKATILESTHETVVTIPTKKNWFLLVFITVWLCGWAIGWLSATGTLTFSGGTDVDAFLAVWLTLWTIGGFFIINFYVWMLLGKEVITFNKNTITRARKGQLFFRDKTYDVREVKSIRIKEPEADSGFGMFQRQSFSAIVKAGTIHFSYGLQTVKIAAGIDEPEAKLILAKLVEKQYLTEANF